MRYRTRPVEVDARQFYGANGPQLAEWCGGIYDAADEAPSVIISTLEGTMTARLGDWIVRGVKGEFSSFKPDIFEETYDQLDRKSETVDPIEAATAAPVSGLPTRGEVDTDEVDRFRAALEKIDRDIPHSGCGHCGACIAHEALHGHRIAWGRRCCWPEQIRSANG